MARGVSLLMSGGTDSDGLGDIRGTLTVYDDPAFGRRHLRKRFIFMSAFDTNDRVEVFIVGADGACVAFPIPKAKAREGSPE